ncbi:hypothetical protein UPYG_G00094710 [Umbra pygmaea]|uniref:Suppressor of cytokine signaling 1 n=1 Tax=Umbra pygmaea TaxID=75934 RepID=A0ABD0XM78_UMBPY
MVAHSTVDENNTTTATSSPSSSSSPRPRDTLCPTTRSNPSATQPSWSPPSSSTAHQSTRSTRQHPSNHCLATPRPRQRVEDRKPLPVSTHFPLFRCEKDFLLITRTASMLEHSGFYWGPLGVEEAHSRLNNVALGTFLIRDSRQKDVFFTLSYRAASGPVSVRIIYKGQRFNLSGSECSFPCLFALLKHYITSPKKCLSVPFRKCQPTLQELCRKRVFEVCRGEVERIECVSLNPVLKEFLLEFPFGI